MDLRGLYKYLQGCMVAGALEIRDGEGTGGAFILLLMQAGGRFVVEDCELALREDCVLASGRAALPPLAGGATLAAAVRFEVRDGNIWYEIELRHGQTLGFRDFFGNLHWGRAVRDGVVAVIESPLSQMFIRSPVITLNSDNIHESRPFRVRGGVSFVPDADLWADYALWLPTALTLEGSLSLLSKDMLRGGAAFELRIALLGASLFDGLFADVVQGGSLALLVDSEVEINMGEFVPVIEVECTVNLKNLDTPVVLSAALFGTGGTWHFRGAFPEGLSAVDLTRFLMGLFGMPGLNLPPDSPLANFSLFSLQFEFWGGGQTAPNAIRAHVATRQPWVLPLPFITLEELSIMWLGLYSAGLDSAMRTTLDARLTIELFRGRKLRLAAWALLPEMELQAEATFTQTIIPLNDVFGNEPVSSLDAGGEITLASIGVVASSQNRLLSVTVFLRDVLRWKIGNIDFVLESVRANATFAQRGNSFAIEGIFAVRNAGDPFTFALLGGYAEQGWFFRGHLASGQVNIANLLTGLLGISYSGTRSLFILTEFDISYNTKTKTFALKAGFAGDWGLKIGSMDVKMGGWLAISSDADKTHAAVMLSLALGVFEISAQIDDFFDVPSYIFQVRVGKNALRATYAKQDVKGALHEILSLELRDTTLGDLVLMLVRMVNPNHRHSLPSPWNLLHKIDLSRLRLNYDLTDESLNIVYTLGPLRIPGLLEISAVGLEYAKPESGGNHALRFVVKGKTPASRQEETFGWDALRGTPPNVAQKSNKFKLRYIGMGQRFSTAAIGAATDIPAALTAMKDSFALDEIRFDSGVNWIFGLDFQINNMLDVAVVFNDPALYGIRITVSDGEGPLSNFEGLILELLYRKISKDIGMFKATLRMPDRFSRMEFGVFSFTLGVFSLEVYTNGNFLLDLGFPHDANFESSFSLQAGIYTGCGGLYFGVLSGATAPNLPTTTLGTFESVLAIGVGASFGIGRSFDFGIVKGGLSLEVFGIFEGLFAVFKPNEGRPSMYYAIHATIGLTGRVFVSVDLKIITIQASAELRAYASVTIVAHQPMLFALDVSLTMGASIKILFIRVSFSFTFSRRFNFTIGSASPAPWGLPIAERAPLNRGFYKQIAMMQKTGLAMRILPLFSTSDTGRHCAAFVPVMESEDFRGFVRLLAGWTLNAWEDKITAAEAAQLNFDSIKEQMNYAHMNDFFTDNLEISLIGDSAETIGQLEGVVLAMPPALSLRFNPDGEDDYFAADYGRDNLVNPQYAVEIEQFFHRLNPDPMGAALSDCIESGEDLPLAQIVFVDYIHMLLRELIEKLHSLFVSADISFGNRHMCGLAFSQLLQPDTTLNGGVLPIERYPISMPTLAGIADIAAKCGVAAPEITQAIGDTPGLLAAGISFKMPEQSFTNTHGMTTEQAAAFFFVRHNEFALEGYYQKLETAIIEENTSISLDWEEQGGGTTLQLPDGRIWHALPGDSVTRLAKSCALARLNEGDLPPWDAYRAAFIKANPATAPDTFTIPATTLNIEGDSSLNALVRRVLAINNAEPLTHIPIIRPFAVMDVPFILTIDEGATLESLLQTGLPFEVLATALEKNSHFIDPAQKITATDMQWIDKSLALRFMEDADYIDHIAAMASRFMLQGLRLPAPGAFLGNHAIATCPFYELLLQQTDITDDPADWLLEAAANGDCGWLVGAIRDELPWSMIEQELPKGFDWTKHVLDFAAADATITLPKSYNAASSTLLSRESGAVALHMLNSELINELPLMDGLAVLDRQDSDASLAAFIPITLRRTARDNDFELEGARAEHRNLLRGVAMQAAAGGMVFDLCFAPNPLQSEGMIFAKNWDAEHCVLVRSNLSLETHRAPVRGEGGTHRDICTMAEPMFLQMLWECSVVGGGGYWLRLQAECGNTLPDDIFDESGRGELWLVVHDSIDDRLRQAGLANVAITAVGVGNDPAFATKSATFAPKNPTNPQLFVQQPNLPPGCAGFDIKLSKPAEDDHPHMLFNILEYKISGDGYDGSQDSVPIHPKDCEEDAAKWEFNPVIPVYAMVDTPEADIYSPVGKPFKAMLYCRDILGNRAPHSLTSEAITPVYNDEIISIGSWPFTRISYGIAAGRLHLTFAATELPTDDDETIQAAIGLMERACLQLRWGGVRARLATTLFDNGWDEGVDTALTAYANALLAYLQKRQDAPLQTTEFTFENTMHKNPEPYSLIVSIKIYRIGTFPEKVRSALYHVPPMMDDEETGEQTFAADLETAFVSVKLARAANGGYVIVPVGADGMFGKINIAPTSRMVGGVEVAAPCYWGIRPLSNRRIDGIDMDVLAARFLGDVEGVLTSDANLRAAIAHTQNLQKIIHAKEDLATCAQKQLIPIEESFAPTTHDAGELLKDKMRRSLHNNTPFAAIAEFTLKMESAAHLRMPVHLSRAANDADVSGLRGAAGKIDSSKTSFLLIYESDDVARSGFSADWGLAITELEHNIRTHENGYEQSDWLQFVIPITAGALLDDDLTSQLSIPNPLRQCPASPELRRQDGVFNDEILYNWEYRLTCATEIAEQDSFHFEIAFAELQTPVKATGESLFTLLCSYDQARAHILPNLNAADDATFAQALEQFAQMATDIARAWDIWLATATSKAAAADICTADVQARFGDTVTLTTQSNREGVYAAFDDSADPDSLHPGNRAVFTLHIPHLSVYRYYYATPTLQTSRNINLLKIKGRESFAPVNPLFTYQTDKLSLPTFAAGQEVSAEIPVASYLAPLTRQSLQTAVGTLLERLGLQGTKVSAAFAVTCRYPLNPKAHIELPIALLPPMPCNDPALSQTLLKGIWQNLSADPPSRDTLSLFFHVTISHANKTILSFSRMRIDFAPAALT